MEYIDLMTGGSLSTIDYQAGTFAPSTLPKDHAFNHVTSQLIMNIKEYLNSPEDRFIDDNLAGERVRIHWTAF